MERAPRIFAYLVLGLLLGGPARAETRSLAVELAAGRRDAPLEVTVRGSWLGTERTAELRDDGTAPGDVRGDFVYVGVLRGPPVRAVDLVISVEGSPVGEALVLLEGRHDRVSFVLDGGAARRAALAATSSRLERRETVELAAIFGWTLLLLVAVLGLARRTRR